MQQLILYKSFFLMYDIYFLLNFYNEEKYIYNIKLENKIIEKIILNIF